MDTRVRARRERAPHFAAPPRKGSLVAISPNGHGRGRWHANPGHGTLQATTQDYMVVTPELNGRMQKRLPVVVVVQFGREQELASAAELTYTENVSAHGACLISNRAWQPGERARVTSCKDHITLHGKVVHCRKCRDDRYAVGLTFQGREVTWVTYRTYAQS